MSGNFILSVTQVRDLGVIFDIFFSLRTAGPPPNPVGFSFSCQDDCSRVPVGLLAFSTCSPSIYSEHISQNDSLRYVIAHHNSAQNFPKVFWLTQRKRRNSYFHVQGYVMIWRSQFPKLLSTIFPFFILLKPHWPCLLDTLGMSLPQGFFTCFLFLECLFLKYLYSLPALASCERNVTFSVWLFLSVNIHMLLPCFYFFLLNTLPLTDYVFYLFILFIVSLFH